MKRSYLELLSCATFALFSIDDCLAQEAKLIITVSENQLGASVTFHDKEVTSHSPLGLVVDNQDLGKNIEIQEIVADPTAKNGYGKTYILKHKDGSISFMDTREYDNGVALRYRIPTENAKCIYKENTSFTFPTRTQVWYASGPFQYGWLQAYQKRATDSISGELLAPPATFLLPDGTYTAITETNLFNFHGAVLFGTSPNRVQFGFVENEGHLKTGRITGLPPKRYYHSAVRDVPWIVTPREGQKEIVTPWRILMLADNLNGLVNNDIMAQVADAPDKTLFPEGKTDWIKPGRAVFTWLVSDKSRLSLNVHRKYVDAASELGLETVVVDDGWERWATTDKEANGRNKWEMIKELVDYARPRNVDIWVWRSSSPRWGNKTDAGLEEEEERKNFMKKCAEMGVKGLKIDFFHTENLFTVNLMEDILKEAAKNKLLVVFHGVNKPAGESFTYPNLLAKEAVRGLECVGAEKTWAPGPAWPFHNTVIPFTRWLAGAADYTPLNFRKAYHPSLTFTHHLASIYMYTSPMLILATDREDLLNSPGREFIEEVPVVWDETRVLPQSEIGTLAAMARRKGETWYITVLNGETPKEITLPLDFLPKGSYRMTYAADPEERKSIVIQKDKVRSGKNLKVKLLSGGGYLARFERINK